MVNWSQRGWGTSQENGEWTLDSNDLVLINGTMKICVDGMLTQWLNEKRGEGVSIDARRVKDGEDWSNWRRGVFVG